MRKEFKAPKSRKGNRGVPLAMRVARELEAHFATTVFQDDDDLVFANPSTGGPLDRSKVYKRGRPRRFIKTFVQTTPRPLLDPS